MISTRTRTEDGDKHKNNTNEVAKHKNDARLGCYKNNANEAAKQENDGI